MTNRQQSLCPTGTSVPKYINIAITQDKEQSDGVFFLNFVLVKMNVLRLIINFVANSLATMK